MPNPPNISRNWFLTLGVALALLPATENASAGGAEKVLYAFQGGADGNTPYSTLIADKNGNLYGTTFVGGDGCKDPGCGTTFEVAPDGAETILHAFGGFKNGRYYLGPRAGLVADKDGNLYGTTVEGGKAGDGCGGSGCGTVYKLAPDGTETVLYAFKGSLNGNSDGLAPYAGLIIDKAGNLYGTTLFGGDRNCTHGCGTVFKVAPDGTETVLYSFQGGNDGAYPYAALIADKAGNLYGTTSGADLGKGTESGTIFRVAPDGTETVLHVFGAQPDDGAEPYAGLIADAAGNLYGTTSAGGTAYFGTVFQLAPDGTETILYSFQGNKNGGVDAGDPAAALIEDKAGNFYGTAGGGEYEKGTVFRITPDGKEKVIYSFAGGADGAGPYGGLLLGKHGELYGTTVSGGDLDGGTVFEVKK